jgi:hypothetical protein
MCNCANNMWHQASILDLATTTITKYTNKNWNFRKIGECGEAYTKIVKSLEKGIDQNLLKVQRKSCKHIEIGAWMWERERERDVQALKTNEKM